MRLYFFGNGQADGSGALRDRLGVKGAELAEMARLGVPVPAGFTLSTDVCAHLKEHGWDANARALLREGIGTVESMCERTFGGAQTPLLVSVRAGATQSLPGCLTTVLNVGLNAQNVDSLAQWADNPYFAWQVYLRAQEDFGHLVQGIDRFYFEEERDITRRKFGIHPGEPLTLDALHDLHRRFGDLPEQWETPPAIDAPWEQLRAAIDAAIASFDAPATRILRQRDHPTDTGAIAVNIQAMVFGNVNAQSGTGILWTRHRRTGAPGIDGDFLFQAQGEDVEHRLGDIRPLRGPHSLEERLPKTCQRLGRIGQLLESHYRDMQQIEFTIEHDRLWVLQTSDARRSFEASMRVAVDLVDEGLLTEQDALQRIDPTAIRRLLHPRIQPDETQRAVARGIPTSPGAATGRIVLRAEDAERLAAELNVAVILIKIDTAPDDIRAIRAARGVVTARGGMTSHAAVITRQMGKPSVVGCRDVFIDQEAQTARVGEHVLRPGDLITIDGSTGEIFEGELPLQPPIFPDAWNTLIQWADSHKNIAIRANADSAGDAGLAMELGAEGIGLVRTEHMFFRPQRLNIMREMIVAQNPAQRDAALRRLQPFQTEDFYQILKAVHGAPVTVRLLDPPLHEFLPQREEDLRVIANKMGIAPAEIQRIANGLREQNPMLGHRGCRLAISWPEIYDMQTTALFDAMQMALREGTPVHTEILVPLVSDPEEFRHVRDRIFDNYRPWAAHPGMPERPQVGSMIEVARACLLADKIANLADFISYGTNDLTQSIYGLSRDDTSSFLPAYLERGIMTDNPFAVLDEEGVGWFMQMASRKARAANPTIRIGACGEQSANPRTVAWLQKGIVDYISSSPYRVPVTRFAAGRAATLHHGHNQAR